MARYIELASLVAEIDKRIMEAPINHIGHQRVWAYNDIKDILNTLEVKEVDLDALGVLANHLIACDAHLVTPKYTDKEYNLLEEWAKNNKIQNAEKC